MAGSRRHRPLFDLIGDSTGRSGWKQTPHAESGEPEVKPPAPPATPPPSPPPAASAPPRKPETSAAPASTKPSPEASSAERARSVGATPVAPPKPAASLALEAEIKGVALSPGVESAERPRRIDNGIHETGIGERSSRVDERSRVGSPVSEAPERQSERLPERSSPRPRLHPTSLRALAMYAVGAAIALSVLVWLIAFRAGQSQKQRELEPFLQATVPVDPLAQETGARQEAGRPDTGRPDTGAAKAPPPRPGPPRATTSNSSPAKAGPVAGQPTPRTPDRANEAGGDSRVRSTDGRPAEPPPLNLTPDTSGRGPILVAGGTLASDPRIAELNYYVIERLPLEEARNVIEFLADAGVQAIGSPEGDRIVIIAVPGITRDDYRANSAYRQWLEARIAELGKLWQREHRGNSDFSRPLWVRLRS
ncbi:MAG: hypothetical protein SFZ23_11985 [Planctomycetota bacterium]|nr:hypothetical protein [Planctomycetota bacterium]